MIIADDRKKQTWFIGDDSQGRQRHGGSEGAAGAAGAAKAGLCRCENDTVFNPLCLSRIFNNFSLHVLETFLIK